jgi:8-oxo-dGTP diphosphatase
VGESVEPRECIACMLIRDGMLLAEKRKLTKTVVPGAVALPGGHLEAGEQPEEALQRELEEELGIAPVEVRYVCTLLHRSQEFRKLHYFVVTQWEGNIRNREAASLMWLPFTALQELDLDVDRLAVAEYLRVYGEP